MKIFYRTFKCQKINIIKEGTLDKWKIQVNMIPKDSSNAKNIFEMANGTIVQLLEITEETDIIVKDFYHLGYLIEQSIKIKSKANKESMSSKKGDLEFFKFPIDKFLIENLEYNDEIENFIIELYNKYGAIDVEHKYFNNELPKDGSSIYLIELLSFALSIYTIYSFIRYKKLEMKKMPKLTKWIIETGISEETIQTNLLKLLPTSIWGYQIDSDIDFKYISDKYEDKKMVVADVCIKSSIPNVQAAIAIELMNIIIKKNESTNVGICKYCGRYITLISKRQKYCIPTIGSPNYEEELECRHKRDLERKYNKSNNKK